MPPQGTRAAGISRTHDALVRSQDIRATEREFSACDRSFRYDRHALLTRQVQPNLHKVPIDIAPHQPSSLRGIRGCGWERPDLVAQKRAVRAKGGQVGLREQRSDFRGLIGGISSYPVPIASFFGSTSHEQNLLRSWMVDSDAFFASEFGPSYVAAVFHSHETCPHLHHYVVGPAAHLHPGLRAELENGRRIDDDRERLRRYRQAMRDFLDRYYAHVGCKYGHKRSGNIRPSPRVPDRKSYLVQKQAERLFQEMGASNAEALVRIIYERHGGHR